MDLRRLQDDALTMLRRPAQRLQFLAQLSALAEATGTSEGMVTRQLAELFAKWVHRRGPTPQQPHS
jgi:hypothetical protein